MHFEPKPTLAAISLAAALFAGLPGCGGGDENELRRAAVQGTVTLDRVKLKEGMIRFVPTAGTAGPKTSVSIKDGQFVATAERGPVIGSHRVEIQSTDNGGYAMDDETAIARLKAAGKTRINAVRVPAAYNRRSTLKAAVTADGPNVYDFSLSTSPHQRRR